MLRHAYPSTDMQKTVHTLNKHGQTCSDTNTHTRNAYVCLDMPRHVQIRPDTPKYAQARTGSYRYAHTCTNVGKR